MTKESKDVFDLEHIKNTIIWDSLAELHSDTLKNINSQILLVSALREQYVTALSKEISDQFIGLDLSFKDLIRETIVVGLSHAETVDTVKVPNSEDLEFATEFYSGKIKDDDGALAYVHTCTQYLNIQDKTVNLISLGWVDLFTKLKISTDNLSNVISDATGVNNATIH